MCQHYQKKGMFNSKCKRCGGPKKGHAVSSYTGKPDELLNLCESSSSTPPTAKVDELIAAGINLRYQVRVKRDLVYDSSEHM